MKNGASDPEATGKTGRKMGDSRPFETVKGRRLGLWIVLLAGICVFYPAVRAPLFLDDYLHAAMVEGTFPGQRGPFDLYDFVDDGDRALLAERGLLPWWSHPQLTIRFLRPLSSALLWMVHRVSSHGALPMHLHSLAWWLAAVLAVGALYNRFFSPRVALLGTAMFAVSPCHALPLAWVANSETLVALVFGALALSWQMRFRGGAGLRDAAIATLFFTLSLLGGGEYALAFGGYVLAIEVVHRRRGTLLSRALDHLQGVLPFLVPAGAYLVVRSALHYGAVGSGFYSDPFRDPTAFVRLAPYRVVALLADSWLTLGSETWRSGGERWALAGVVLAAGAALVVPIPPRDRHARARVERCGSCARLGIARLPRAHARRRPGVSSPGREHDWRGGDERARPRASVVLA